jgi:hypothetical protein
MFAFSILMMACTVTRYDGMYVGTPCDGWDHSRGIGAGATETYIARHLGLSVVPQANVSTNNRDEVYVAVDSGKGPPSFERYGIVVSLNDRGQHQIYHTPVFTVHLDGCRDFSVDVPSYSVDGVPVPRLEARFRWSDSPVYLYRGP